MFVNIQDDILKLHQLGLLDKVLVDRTTKGQILWASDVYSVLGREYNRDAEIKQELITGENAHIIKTRARKSMEQQAQRTRRRGEVFSPLWICQKMNDYVDEMWGDRADWQRYVLARQLEITCGEAPYLVSRYDVATGEAIPIHKRIGLLDRKLRMVNEHTAGEDDWLYWAMRAFESIYGYDFQGDNVLIARVNLLMTFAEYWEDRWQRKAQVSEYKKILPIITWNIWQMDGLTGAIPYSMAQKEFQQMDIFDLLGEPSRQDKTKPPPNCRIYNWRGKSSVEFITLPTRGKRAMKFDFIIGNPPYQDETIGDNKGFAPPIYHLFLDEAYKVANKVELIHPARFLFDAGSTPKAWNQKMLNDEHLKVISYEPISSNIFPNTDIKGGIAITYRDDSTKFGAIHTFIVFEELRSIMAKVNMSESQGLNTIAYASEAYRFTDTMHYEHPEVEALLSKGHKYDFKTSVLEKLDGIVFFSEKPSDEASYVQIIGLIKGTRCAKWIKRQYVKEPTNFDSYKIFIPKANGSGALGEVLSTPMIGHPMIGHTQTFISIGDFKSESEAEACLKYIKTKFARTMLGVLKITQDNPPDKWRYVPLQDFTASSDIDWSQAVADIDRQLYAKYGLDEQEIAFIESHVKEMV